MAGVDDALARLGTDFGFRAQLVRDPATALAGYELTTDDLGRIARALDRHEPSASPRATRAALFSLLARREAAEQEQ